ncbi:hypothetical protein [Arcobacter sp. LA11]|uniref:hypothetical protein n=1 Tax=Arcobacter sp. LA11 TaxID=1898176 RepID=UPI000934F501|nr:hypothetical protein [Arcobacter sp. LA11]
MIFFLTFTSVFAKKIEVNWHITKFPPFMNINDKHKDGICIDAMNTAINKLTDYEHKISMVPFSRTMEEIKTSNLICAPCLLKNKDREDYIYFSKSFTALAMQLGLVVKSKSIEKIKKYISNENDVDLEKLLDSNIFKLGIANGRSYSFDIDNIIKKYEGKKNLYKRSGANISDGFIQMMIVDRDIDGTIIYNTKLDILLKKYKKELKKDFVFIKIKNLPNFNHVYIGCSKSKDSQEFINSLNNNILDIRESAISFQKKMKREDSKYIDMIIPTWDEMLKSKDDF